jgi:hypothetical protein
VLVERHGSVAEDEVEKYFSKNRGGQYELEEVGAHPMLRTTATLNLIAQRVWVRTGNSGSSVVPGDEA